MKFKFDSKTTTKWFGSQDLMVSLPFAWNQVRVSYPAVSWHSIVWFKD